MPPNADYGTVIDRGRDSSGYALAPRSSCCHASVVARAPGGHGFTPVHFTGHRDGQYWADFRCGVCNRPLAPNDGSET